MEYRQNGQMRSDRAERPKEVSELRSLSLTVMPVELLATGYARAVTAKGMDILGGDITSENSTFVISEAALTMPYCSPEDMRLQIMNLLAMAAFPGLEILILPMDVIPSAPLDTGYTIYEDSLLVVQTMLAELSFTDTETIKKYTDHFDRHASDALASGRTKALLTEALDHWTEAVAPAS